MYLKHINFTRFIAAISVVIFHYGGLAKPFENNFLHTLFNAGNLFVLYFFVLSGFILTIAYYEKIETLAYKNFIILRLGRIYPAFLFSIFLSIILLIIQKLPINIYQTFKMLSLTHGWINPWIDSSGRLLNPPAWTLSLEFFFYLTFPFVFKRLRIVKTTNLKLIIIFCLFYNYLTQINTTELGFIHKIRENLPQPFLYYHIFILGICMGLLFIRKSIKIQNQNLNSIIIAFIIGLTIFLITFSKIDMWHSTSIIFCYSLFIWYWSNSNSNISAFFSNKVFVVLGDISFGIYILQYPVKNLYDYFLAGRGANHITIYFYGYLVILILISIFSYFIIEKPIQNSLKIYFKKTAVQKIQTILQ